MLLRVALAWLLLAGPAAAQFFGTGGGVVSVNGRQGPVTITLGDITGPLSAGLGIPFGGTGATTAAAARINLGLAAVASSGAYADLIGAPAPYALPAASSTVLGGVRQGSGVTIAGDGTLSATGTSGVSTFNARAGSVTLSLGDVTAALGYTPIAASGAPVQSVAGRTGAVTLSASDLSGTLGLAAGGTGATTAAGARAALGLATVATTGAYADLIGAPSLSTYAPLDSPNFLNAVRVPTAAAGTNSTQAASTAFVQATIAAGGITASSLPASATAVGATDSIIAAQAGSPDALVRLTPAQVTRWITDNPLSRATVGNNGTVVMDQTNYSKTILLTGAATIQAPPAGTNLGANGGDGYALTILNPSGYTASFASNGAVNIVTPSGTSVSGTPITTNSVGSYRIHASTASGSLVILADVRPSSTYTLPIATSSVLGGVKQGSGVTIAGDGTLSATGTSGVSTFNARSGSVTLTSSDVTTALGGTPLQPAAIPAASAQLLGGSGAAGAASAVTVGSGLSLSAGTLTASGGSGGGGALNLNGTAFRTGRYYSSPGVVQQGGAVAGTFVYPMFVPAASTVTSLSLYLASSTSYTLTYSMALYADNGGIPGSRLVTTGQLTYTAGTSGALSTTVSQPLSYGTVWVAVSISAGWSCNTLNQPSGGGAYGANPLAQLVGGGSVAEAASGNMIGYRTSDTSGAALPTTLGALTANTGSTPMVIAGF